MSKNIVICYDGTGNEYGDNNTNVVKIFEHIVRDKEQIGFYDPGVGTFSSLGRNFGKKVGAVLGKAFGAGLQQNIEDGYEYLMNRFEEGDKVFIFGFSRGAFTARKLAGMLHCFGVLQKGSKNLIPYVSKMYLKRNFDVCQKFKASFSHECKPHLIGVWDTVASLGYFHGKKFSNQTLNQDIKYAYQAISIDEKRKMFPVSIWDESKKSEQQTIEQVWFSGVHSDVGGYYTNCGLSDIALAWMMDKAIQQGLRIKENWTNNLQQNCLGTLHNSRARFWKLWRKVDRIIPVNAKIHESVFQRQEKDKNYKPSNVFDGHRDNQVSNDSYCLSEHR
ncbi:DUF2235 domain-containing protein [Candidatus Spongiihabitans sp.]|uniref:DUF2235 domain-containing protein n=1 Tax=Candidatus Spongiihabitans sp. TaxID=3101308 RepID=UPI003C6F9051